MTTTGTKDHWRRRALRAEEQLKSLRQIRNAEASMERALVYQNSVMRVALEEIESTLADMRQALKDAP